MYVMRGIQKRKYVRLVSNRKNMELISIRTNYITSKGLFYKDNIIIWWIRYIEVLSK